MREPDTLRPRPWPPAPSRPHLEDDVRAYLRSKTCRDFLAREQEYEMDGLDRVLVNLGLLVIAWVLFLGLIKAVLQLCGLWP